MENDHLRIWKKVDRPPVSALKPIQAGRLKGKSDISPMWRMQAVTELFGPCGIGWKYTIDKLWAEPGQGGEVAAFALVSFYYREEGEWGAPVPGIGGSMLVEQEKNGLHTSDEAFKMAVTDALSVALKSIGVAAEVYLGNFDGSKYKVSPPPQQSQKPQGEQGADCITEAQQKMIFAKMKSAGVPPERLKEAFKVESSKQLKKSQVNDVVAWIEGEAQGTGY